MTPQPPEFGPGSTFRAWIANTLIPQLALALNAPCLTSNPNSMESLLSQYALMSRTPPAIDRGHANINQGLPAMNEGIKHFAGECYADYWPFELRRSHVSRPNLLLFLYLCRILGLALAYIVDVVDLLLLFKRKC